MEQAAVTDELPEVEPSEGMAPPRRPLKRRRSVVDTTTLFQQDHAESNGPGYAILKARNRSMWSALRAAKLELANERECRSALETGQELMEETRTYNEHLEAKVTALRSEMDIIQRERELLGDVSSSQTEEQPSRALDAALVTCAALLAERALLRGSKAKVMRVEVPAPRDDKIRRAEAEAREAAITSKLAAAEESWRGQLAQLSSFNNTNEATNDNDLGCSTRMQLEALKRSVETLETHLESARKPEAATDLQARLLEEIDQTAAALTVTRSQLQQLSEENVKLAAQKAVDSALRSKLESAEVVVAEMKTLLVKKSKLLDDYGTEIGQLRATARSLAEQLTNIKDKLQTTSRDTTLTERKLLDHRRALDEAAAIFAQQLVDSETKHQAQLQRHLEQANIKASRKAPADKIDQVRIKSLENKIQCSVCLEREKAVVIARCYHAFCKICIDTVIATRNRKCPACAKPFGTTDVHPVYLVE